MKTIDTRKMLNSKLIGKHITTKFTGEKVYDVIGFNKQRNEVIYWDNCPKRQKANNVKVID